MFQYRFYKSLLPLALLCLALLVFGAFTSDLFPARRHSKTVREPPSSVATGDDMKANGAVPPTLGHTEQTKKSDEAFVALQYGNFFLGLRVLGQSLRESRTSKDMIALCMPDVPEHHREILRKEGWIVRSVDSLPKSCIGEHKYSSILTKLQSWLLTEYKRVVVLDSDTIVLRNVDSMTRCGEFCAVYRHSDLFNAGVMVLKPSVETFWDICSTIRSVWSLADCEQPFMNYYYKNVKKAPMYWPTDKQMEDDPPYRRLPSEYNGDVGMYYLNNKWMYLDNDEPYILHYTLGPVKPWKWWSYPLFPLNWKWKNLRDRLPPTDLWEPSLWDWDSWFPLVLLLIYTLTAKLWLGLCTEHISKSSAVRYASTIFNPVGHCTMKIVPTFLLLTAQYCSFYQVPETMYPIEGWTRCGLWTLMFFFLPFSMYCHLSYVVGLQSNGVKGTVSAVRPWNIVMEALLWTMTSATIFYLQFFVPITMDTKGGRALGFFGLEFMNLVVCYWWGRRLVRLCYKLGLSSSSLVSNYHPHL